MNRRIPARLRFAALVGVFHLIVFGLLRFGFWLAYRDASPSLSAADTAHGFYLGAKFDARLVVVLLVPLLALGFIPRLDPLRSATARRGWAVYFVLADAFFLFAYAVDFAHFGWLHERVNASVLDNLLAPLISLQTIWESYPVGWAFLGFLLLLAGDYFLLRFVVNRVFGAADATRGRWAWVVALLLIASISYGKWSRYPLRWSDAFFSNDAFAAALSLNPVLYFADTVADRHHAFDEKILRPVYPALAARLGVDQPDPKTMPFRRDVKPSSHALPTKPNIVIVFMESFSALKTGRFGHTPDLNPTPEYDRISKDSIFFDHYFVPRPPTARAIFTTLFGIPDVNPDRSASRNPRIVRQHTIVNAFEGYDKLYLLGGSANWGNIRGMLDANIPGLRLYEEGSYATRPDDVWGINDLALLEESDKIFSAETKPFIAFVQLAGNHPPYTIPQDKRSFETVKVDAKTLENNGFASLEAYNGIRFMDYAIGNYFRVAKDHDYFRNTVYFLYGDHGTATTLDAPYKKVGLSSFHIPCSIYSPGNLPAREIHDVVSSVDVLPTAAGLAGFGYVDTTLGRDMLEPRPKEEHFAFVNTDNTRGVVTDDFALTYDPAGVDRLYRYDSSEPTKDLGRDFPEKKKELEALTDALGNAAGWMLYHNPPVLPQDGAAATK